MHKDPLKLFKNRFIGIIRIYLNILKGGFEAYILNKWQSDKIHNDLGASHTKIERKKNRIIKRALPEGEQDLRTEIEWYLLFQKSPLRKKFPKIYRHSLEPGNVFYEMKYYDLPNLRKIILEGMNAQFFIKLRWRILFHQLLKFLYTEENSSVPGENFFKKTHLDKYHNRMESTKQKNPDIIPILEKKVLTINKTQYLSSDILLQEVASNQEYMQALTPDKVYYAHGDVHCNNMLCGIRPGRIILLDCRGKSMEDTLYFDPAYDLAKLYHDLRSFYSMIERHMFTLFVCQRGEKLEIEYKFLNKEVALRFKEHFLFVRALVKHKMTNFGNINYRADFTEAMLYLTMGPLHSKSRSELVMCLMTGVIRLNEWFEKYHQKRYRELQAKHGISSDQ